MSGINRIEILRLCGLALVVITTPMRDSIGLNFECRAMRHGGIDETRSNAQIPVDLC
jgi:hypothetical protein